MIFIKMLLNIYTELHSFFSKMIDNSHKIVMNQITVEMKVSRFLSGYALWIFLFSIIIIIISHLLSCNIIPWNYKHWKRNKEENKSLELAPYTSVIKHSTFPDIRDERLPNFLPDTQDLQVCEDVIFDTQISTKPRKKKDYSSSESEALTAMRMALQLKANGKMDKALRLFQHAMALHPVQPDILNHYGEFLEAQDIVKADHMYTRALSVCPQHSKALVNRQRTLPVVEEIDEKQLISIDRKRDRLIQIPSNDPALKRMKKEAYFQHIYHTVAIEGNTMTLSETRMVVETRMAVPGKSIMEHNEILGLEAALKYLNTSLISKYGLLTIEDILQIHRRVLGYVDPIGAGAFRTTQVYVGEHTPPPPTQIYTLMQEFVDWLNSEEVVKLHPVKHAALAHYKLVYIHPFVDGNGRTARLLMNLILMRAGYPPVIIRKQDRSIYYDYLQLANEGDVRPFTRFIAECTERTLDVYLYATEVGIYNIRALESQEQEPVTNNKIMRSN